MSAWFWIPNKSDTELNALRATFLRRGFGKEVSFSTQAGELYVYPKFDGTQNWWCKNGETLVVSGTLWYKGVLFPACGEHLTDDIGKGAFDTKLIQGTYALLWINQRKILTVHIDPNACHRIYWDKETNIMSSSFLSLAWLKKRNLEEVNRQAVFETLLLGFTLGKKTWISNIERLTQTNQVKHLSDVHIKKLQKCDFSSIKLSRSDIIAKSNELLKQVLSKTIGSVNNHVVLGLSSGYDSRLVTAAFPKTSWDRLSFFTFHKPGDKDPVIAQQIAIKCGKILRKIETSVPKTESELADVQQKAFLFFDGQVAVMMRYGKEDYTREYREKIFRENDIQISGVGGELFRNYNHDHYGSVDIRFWLNSYFSGGQLHHWLLNVRFMSSTMKELEHRLQLSEQKISYRDRKRFYGDVFLSDWHGIRNTIENQFGAYYSPFTDPELINMSYNTIQYHGYDGQFEADMIKALSKPLAQIPSEYGHTMNAIPWKTKLKSFVGAQTKRPLLSVMRRMYHKRRLQPIKTTNEKYPYLSELFSEDLNVDYLAGLKPEIIETTEYALLRLFCIDL